MSGVSIITSTIRQHCIDNVFDNYSKQSYKNKELIIILNKNDMDIDKWQEKAITYPNVRIFKLDESISLGECLNFAVKKAKYNYISKFDDDNYYGANFIQDLMKVFSFRKVDIVGKLSYFVYFKDSKILALSSPRNSNRYVNFLSGSAMIIKKNVLNKVPFPNLTVGEDTLFLRTCLKYGFKLYSSDQYNYVCIRKSSLDEHTWKITEDDMMKTCVFVIKTDNFEKYVNK